MLNFGGDLGIIDQWSLSFLEGSGQEGWRHWALSDTWFEKK